MIGVTKHPAPELWQADIAIPAGYGNEARAVPVQPAKSKEQERWSEFPAQAWEGEGAWAAAAAELFATALDNFSDAVSWFPDGDPDLPGTGWRVNAVFRQPPDHEAIDIALTLAAASLGCEAPTPSYERLPATDWVTANLASFEPIDAGRFYIHGTHDEGAIPAGRVVLTIDAGAAFGSGEHATTQGCLLALDRLLRRRRFARPLDVGSGSGILAMAVAKAEKVRVLATDIDPVAVRVAAANVRMNGLAAYMTTRAADGFASKHIARSRDYDLIFANILARPLTRMAFALSARLAPDGVAILAGLLGWQERTVLSAYERAGLSLVGRVRLRGWTTLVLSRARLRPL